MLLCTFLNQVFNYQITINIKRHCFKRGDTVRAGVNLSFFLESWSDGLDFFLALETPPSAHIHKHKNNLHSVFQHAETHCSP